jgi:hypothetical protein
MGADGPEPPGRIRRRACHRRRRRPKPRGQVPLKHRKAQVGPGRPAVGPNRLHGRTPGARPVKDRLGHDVDAPDLPADGQGLVAGLGRPLKGRRAPGQGVEGAPDPGLSQPAPSGVSKAKANRFGPTARSQVVSKARISGSDRPGTGR